MHGSETNAHLQKSLLGKVDLWEITFLVMYNSPILSYFPGFWYRSKEFVANLRPEVVAESTSRAGSMKDVVGMRWGQQSPPSAHIYWLSHSGLNFLMPIKRVDWGVWSNRGTVMPIIKRHGALVKVIAKKLDKIQQLSFFPCRANVQGISKFCGLLRVKLIHASQEVISSYIWALFVGKP